VKSFWGLTFLQIMFSISKNYVFLYSTRSRVNVVVETHSVHPCWCYQNCGPIGKSQNFGPSALLWRLGPNCSVDSTCYDHARPLLQDHEGFYGALFFQKLNRIFLTNYCQSGAGWKRVAQLWPQVCAQNRTWQWAPLWCRSLSGFPAICRLRLAVNAAVPYSVWVWWVFPPVHLGPPLHLPIWHFPVQHVRSNTILFYGMVINILF